MNKLRLIFLNVLTLYRCCDKLMLSIQISESEKGDENMWRAGYGNADCLEILEFDSDDQAWWPIAFIELEDHGAKPTPEQEARAYLMAAAPTLLRACKAAYSEELISVRTAVECKKAISLAENVPPGLLAK